MDLEPCMLTRLPRADVKVDKQFCPRHLWVVTPGCSLSRPEKGGGMTLRSSLAAATSCFLTTTSALEALAVMTASREQIGLLHSL